MGDGGKICYSKALATAGRVAYNASNGRVIYKRATDTKHATITLTFVSSSSTPYDIGAYASWTLSPNSITVGAGDSGHVWRALDFMSEGLHSSWVNGVVENIESSAPSAKTLQFRAWLSEYNSYGDELHVTFVGWTTEYGFAPGYVDITVTQDGVPPLSDRFDTDFGLMLAQDFRVGFDSSGKAIYIEGLHPSLQTIDSGV